MEQLFKGAQLQRAWASFFPILHAEEDILHTEDTASAACPAVHWGGYSYPPRGPLWPVGMGAFPVGGIGHPLPRNSEPQKYSLFPVDGKNGGSCFHREEAVSTRKSGKGENKRKNETPSFPPCLHASKSVRWRQTECRKFPELPGWPISPTALLLRNRL